jgi:RNA polymerase sigma-70 factor (ECF subfamily)
MARNVDNSATSNVYLSNMEQAAVSDLPPQRQQVEDLYVALREGLCRYLISCGLDTARAQETTQDAFLRLYKTLREGGVVEDPRSWVFRVAHNLAADLLRQQRRRWELEENAASGAVDSARNAEENLIERQQAESFRRTVESLPPRQRQCLQLRIQGLKYREIAGVMQVDISTVGELLGRAVRRLRKGDRCPT